MSREEFLPKPTPACPKCKSTDIHHDPKDDPEYTCKECGRAYSWKEAERAGTTPCAAPASPVEDEAPLTAREIIGWRAWDVVITPLGYRLASQGNGGPTAYCTWEPGIAMQAECPHDPNHFGANIPDVSCSCGFYTGISREHLTSLGYHKYRPDQIERINECVRKGTLGHHDGLKVIGQVALCGKVIPGSLGWRAQKVWALTIEVPPFFWRVVKPLHEAYNIPVTINRTMED